MSNPLNRLRKKFIPPQLVVILTSALCEEESPPFIFLGGVGGGHSPPPLVETPHCVRGDRGRRVCRPVAKSARDDGWVIFLGES